MLPTALTKCSKVGFWAKYSFVLQLLTFKVVFRLPSEAELQVGPDLKGRV